MVNPDNNTLSSVILSEKGWLIPNQHTLKILPDFALEALTKPSLVLNKYKKMREVFERILFAI